MKRPSALVLAVLLLLAVVGVAEDEKMEPTAPVRIDAEKLAGGGLEEYEAGESLVVPKGFQGIWEMQGDFRELVVIEKEAYVRAEGE